MHQSAAARCQPFGFGLWSVRDDDGRRDAPRPNCLSAQITSLSACTATDSETAGTQLASVRHKRRFQAPQTTNGKRSSHFHIFRLTGIHSKANKCSLLAHDGAAHARLARLTNSRTKKGTSGTKNGTGKKKSKKIGTGDNTTHRPVDLATTKKNQQRNNC